MQNHTDPRPAVPPPAPAPPVGELSTSLTFFLSMDERRAVLAALRRRHRDRRSALLLALRVTPTPSGGGARDA